MKTGEGKLVCVTGASGYIASWLVNLLLQRGYTVHATVRDLNDAKKTLHLLAFEGANERLKLFKAELVEEGSFDGAIDGCEGVFHTACPLYHIHDAQTELIDPAVKGTINVLKSCLKFKSVKRVIVTSSMASVMFNGKPLTSGVVIDETWFSDPAFCQTIQPTYLLAKTLSEEASWKYAKENGIDMITLHPGLTIGPYLQPTINVTMDLILKYIKGEMFRNEMCRLVDVRDVGAAHIQAFESPSANGRYCLVGNVVNISDFFNIVHKLYPTLPIPNKYEKEKLLVERCEVSKERAKSLGLEFTPLEKTLEDTIEWFKDKGFLTI